MRYAYQPGEAKTRRWGISPSVMLCAAAMMGHVQIMKELLQRRANPNVRTTGEFWGCRKTMPVLHAAVFGHQVIRAAGEIEAAPSTLRAAKEPTERKGSGHPHATTFECSVRF